VLADALTHPVTLAGAFLFGAVLATVAMLRVIRAVAALFDEIERRRRGDD
jgi:uncharacterized membrane protein YesL